MSIKNFIPELWVNRLLLKFKKSLVYAAAANRNYEGVIKNLGDTVRISGLGPITVSAYSGSTLSYQNLESEQQIMKIDQQDYFGFAIDDADKAQAGVVFMSDAMDRAAYALRDTIDQYIAGLYLSAGTQVSTAAVNSVNAYAALLTMRQALTALNVPLEGRWAIIPPWFTNSLVLGKILLPAVMDNPAYENGVVGRAAGFELRESNNVPFTGGTTYQIMAGTNAAISYAGQIDPEKVEALRDKDLFSDFIRGLLLFGAKVVYPDALVNFPATIAAEP
jgi:hypothetical protein